MAKRASGIKKATEAKLRNDYSKLKASYPNLTYDEYIKIRFEKGSHEGVANELNQLQRDENIEINTNPEKIVEDLQNIQQTVNPLVEADKQKEQEAREGYKQEAREDVTTDLPGLTPTQRRQLQQSANAQINKQVQKYQRSMASSTGQRGIRGGAAFAPQAEIARQGMEAQNQFQRDLVEKDTDLAMRRLAAYLASVEGRTAQDILRTGQYLDYITGKQQQGKQAAYETYYDNLFSGVKK